jgi:hypothetical protein
MAPLPQSEKPDPLFELELRIARRADMLALERPQGSSLNLQCWLLAEMEILGPGAIDPPAMPTKRKMPVTAQG